MYNIFITSRHLYDKLLEYMKYATIKNESFEEEILGTIKNGSYASIMHTKALATLTNMHINSIYPMVEYVLAVHSFFHRPMKNQVLQKRKAYLTSYGLI